MKTLHFYTIAASLALGVAFCSFNAQAANTVHNHAQHLPLTTSQLQTRVVVDDLVLFSTLKKELLNARTEFEIDQAVAKIVRYHAAYPHSHEFQVLLNEINENQAYFETRVQDTFDYTAIKKAVGLSIVTGLAVYGIKAIQKKCYEPHDALKEQARAELTAEGVVVPGNHYYGYEFEGYNTNDITVQNKIDAYRTHQLKANASRVGQCAVGTAGFVTGTSALVELYKGLTNDCAREFAHYSLLKVKLEQAHAAYKALIKAQ